MTLDGKEKGGAGKSPAAPLEPPQAYSGSSGGSTIAGSTQSAAWVIRMAQNLASAGVKVTEVPWITKTI